MTVAALYVERGGPYYSMPGVDPWGVDRDARTYAGPHPIVAHPPCGPWSRLRHLYRGSEHDCAPAAVEAVRRWGGGIASPTRAGCLMAMRREVEPPRVVISAVDSDAPPPAPAPSAIVNLEDDVLF